MLHKIVVVIVIAIVGFLGLGFVSMKLGINPPFGIPKPQPANFSQTGPNYNQQVQNPNLGEEDVSRQFSNGKCSGRGATKLSASPIDARDLQLIFPMGKMTGAHVTPTDHQYWVPNGAETLGGLTDEPEKYAIHAPADGYIVSLEHSTQAITEGSKQPPEDDYRIIFEHSCTFYTILIHINKVKKEILDQIRLKESSSSNGHFSGSGRVKVRAGEVIGKSGAHQFDFSVINTQVTLPGFIKPQSYTAEPWKIHTVDPFDYFAEGLKLQLIAKSVRTVPPLGGKIDYDIQGKLVGNWFRQGAGGYFGNQSNRGASGRYWDSHLAIVYDPIDPTKVVVSTGNFNGTAAQFAVLGNLPDPKNMGEKSGVIKYDLVSFDYQTSSGASWNGRTFDRNLKFRAGLEVQGVVLLQVLPNQKLKVEFFPGQTASQVAGFDSRAQIYER